MNRIKTIIIALIYCICGVIFSWAGPIDEKADSAYSADLFDEAIEMYQKAAETEGTSSELFFNLGNAYYRSGKLGMAVLYYERALRLDPSNDDIQANLNFVNSKVADRPGPRGSFISTIFNDVTNIASSNTWAVITLALFIVVIIAVVVYLFSSNVTIRKFGFFGGLLSIFLFIATLVLAFNAKALSTDTEQAIITTPSTILSTSPRTPLSRSEEAMLLHEGTKVYILDSVYSATDSIAPLWYDIKVDNDHRAWINAADVERI